jgi:hypothetical protein
VDTGCRDKENRIAEHLRDRAGPGVLDPVTSRDRAQAIVAMFDAGARDTEVAVYLRQALDTRPGPDSGWHALAATLHRLAADDG